jgi:hypothetical protein
MSVDELEIKWLEHKITANKRWRLADIGFLIFCLSILIIDVPIIYHEPQKWWVSFTCGMMFLNIIIIYQQYSFRKSELRDDRRLLRRMKMWPKEKERLNSLWSAGAMELSNGGRGEKSDN